MLSQQTTCSRCGAPLQTAAIEGFCHRCLAKIAFGTGDGGTSAVNTARIGDYELLGEIGRGGMGVVLRARQSSLGRVVALKVIKQGPFADEAEVTRFRREAAAAASLSHPNIVAIHEIGSEGGHHFFSMDLVEGRTLAELVREGPLPPRRAAHYAWKISQAVAAAHMRGILHRDLKPSNVLIDSADEPRVTDFGLARRIEHADAAITQQIAGSPGYMPPEQIDSKRAPATFTADVYSLGALLYHLVTGRPPFLGDSVGAVLLQVENTEPIAPRLLNPGVPRDLETICLKCLEKEPSRRYASAQELADEFGRFLCDEPIHARPLNAAQRLWRACRRRPGIATLSASVLLLLVTVTVTSSMAAWRVTVARRAERIEREKANVANRSLRNTVGLLELARAEDLFAAGDAAAGVAHLTAILRNDPSNHIAADRLVSALVHRNWALPAAASIRLSGPVEFAQFSPNGKQVLIVSLEGKGSLASLIQPGTDGVVVSQLNHEADGRTAMSSPRREGPGDGSELRNVARHVETNVLPSPAVRHRERILSARFSPDGTRFVTASADGTAQIWSSTNAATLTPPLRHDGKVHFAEFNHDGRVVVTASADRTAGIWDATTGELKRKLHGHASELRFARFSPDGKRVVTGGSTGSIRMWNAESGEMLFRIEDRRRLLTALAFSPDGQRLVVACDDGVARLWDTNTREPVGEPLVHQQEIISTAFSPDSQLVLTASKDCTARLWSARNSRPAGLPLPHEGTLTYGEFSADGTMVVTASMDNSARIWNVQTGKLICQPLRQHEGIVHASFSPDGQRLATASDDWFVQVWDIRPRRSRGREFDARLGVTSVSFAPDGKSVLATFLDGTAHVWDETGKPRLEPMHHAAPVRFGEFSADGQRVATATDDGAAHVWDLRTRESIGTRQRHARTNRMARFSPDGGRIVTASDDGTARVWDARTGELTAPPLIHGRQVVLARFSPDGRFVLTASEDNSARLWDAQTGQCAVTLSHSNHVKWADFSADGQRIATASTDNTAGIWDARTGKLLAPPLLHSRIVERAAFSPDGRRVATASLDRTARIWDATTGEALTPPLKHDSPVIHLSFSPDGQRILTGCWDRSVRLWDVTTGRPLTEWLDAEAWISSACFDATGQRIATAAKGVRVWDVPTAPMPVPNRLVDLAEAAAGIRLSERGNVELVRRERLEEIRQRFAQKTIGDFFEQLTQRFLAEPEERSEMPF